MIKLFVFGVECAFNLLAAISAFNTFGMEILIVNLKIGAIYFFVADIAFIVLS